MIIDSPLFYKLKFIIKIPHAVNIPKTNPARINQRYNVQIPRR